MGYTPIPLVRRPVSRLEQAKRDYVAGRLSVDALERKVDRLLADGDADEPYPPNPPPPPTPARPAEPTFLRY